MITFEEFESFVKREPGFGLTMNRAAAEAVEKSIKNTGG